MKMVRAEILVEGLVTKRGYRTIVEEEARRFSIIGFVENIDNYTVKVVCEGSKENMKRFLNKIFIQDGFINVEKMEVKYKDVSGKFKTFSAKRGKWTEEILESIETGAVHLRAITNKIDRLNDDTNKNFGKLHHSLGGKIEKLNDDTNKNFGKLDVKYGSISEVLKGVANSIDGLTNEIRQDRLKRS